MKNILIFLIVLALASCNTTKKASKLEAATSHTANTSQSTAAQNDTKIQNDLKKNVQTKGTTIKYYPPAVVPPPPSTGDVSQAGSTPVASDPTINTGAIESITTWETSEKTEDQGTVDSKQTQQSNATSAEADESSLKTDETTKPAPDPKRFMWIFLILALVTGIAIYLKRSGVFSWLKSVLSRMRGFLKI